MRRNHAFRVNGKAMRIRQTFILEDPDGNELAKVQEAKAERPRQDGDRAGGVHGRDRQEGARRHPGSLLDRAVRLVLLLGRASNARGRCIARLDDWSVAWLDLWFVGASRS